MTVFNERARNYVMMVLLIVSTGACSLPCLAGITGSISGKVVDQNGDPMPGVTITVLRDKTSQGVFTIESSKKGSFRIPQLNPGNYFVRFEKEGMEPVLRANIRVPTNG